MSLSPRPAGSAATVIVPTRGITSRDTVVSSPEASRTVRWIRYSTSVPVNGVSRSAANEPDRLPENAGTPGRSTPAVT